MIVWCYCESCKYHDEYDTCNREAVVISDHDFTAAGFLPLCQEYEEEEDGSD